MPGLPGATELMVVTRFKATSPEIRGRDTAVEEFPAAVRHARGTGVGGRGEGAGRSAAQPGRSSRRRDRELARQRATSPSSPRRRAG